MNPKESVTQTDQSSAKTMSKRHTKDKQNPCNNQWFFCREARGDREKIRHQSKIKRSAEASQIHHKTITIVEQNRSKTVAKSVAERQVDCDYAGKQGGFLGFI